MKMTLKVQQKRMRSVEEVLIIMYIKLVQNFFLNGVLTLLD
jgi:hypothetical protein